eukprot:81717-Alexandrium_andersonii.AAC.1
MSASLVGSEMCIRDRSSSSCTPPPRAKPFKRPACRMSSWHVVEQGAVSYTHLTLPTICSV